MTVLVIAELAGGAPDDSVFELATAARALNPDRVAVAIAGNGIDGAAQDLTAWFDAVHVYDDERLAAPDGDLWARLFAPLIDRLSPTLTLAAHTNVGLDYAPALAAYTGRAMLADCLSVEGTDRGVRAVRTVHGGKVHARMHAPSGNGVLVTVRPGSVAAAEEAPGCGGTVQTEAWPDGVEPRRTLLDTVAPEAGDVDLTQSQLLVAVGRGIEEEENLEMVETLAEALGADVACTRPIVDSGWMDKNRQIGTSGLSVKPSVYLAVGVSGSFQHMGGVKGGPFIAAINKDPAAPIFGVADVGIVGDLFDLVPLLEEKIRERKG